MHPIVQITGENILNGYGDYRNARMTWRPCF